MARDEFMESVTAELGADASETIKAFRDIERAADSASGGLESSSKRAEQQVAKSAKSISSKAREVATSVAKSMGLVEDKSKSLGRRLWESVSFPRNFRSTIVRRDASFLAGIVLGTIKKAAGIVASGAKLIWESLPLPDFGSRINDDLAQVGDAAPELDAAIDKVEQFSGSVEEAEQESGGLILKLGALAAALAATATAFVGFGIRSISSLSDLAEAAELPIDRFSVLRQGIQNLGVRGGSVDQGVQQLAESLGDLGDNTTEAGAALEALGVTSKDPREALLQIADALATTADTEDRTRAVTALLGDAAKDLIPALEGGRQALLDGEEAARAFGAEIGPEAERNVNIFTRNLRIIEERVKGAGNALKQQAADAVVPYLNDVTNATREGIEQGGTFQGVLQGLRRAFDLIQGGEVEDDPFGVGVALDNFQRADAEVRALAKRLESIESGERIRYNAWGEDLLEITRKQLAQAEQLADEAAGNVARVQAEAAQAVTAAAGDDTREEIVLESNEEREARNARVAAQESAVEAMERELALLQAATDEERARAEVEQGRFKEFDEATKEQVEALQLSIDAEKERIRLADEKLKAEQALSQQADGQIEALERQIELGRGATRADQIRFELARGRFATLEGEQRAELEALATRLQQLDVERTRNQEAKTARDLAEGEVRKLQEQIALVRVKTEAERAGIELSAERFAALTDEERGQIANLRVALDRERQVQSLLGTLETLDQKRQTEIDQIRELARVSTEVRAHEAELIAAINKRYDSMAEKTEEVAGRVEQSGQRAAKSLESSFAEFLFDPFENGLDGMLAGFVDTMRQILSQNISAGIFGGDDGGGGGLAGGLGSFLSFDEGGPVPGGGPVPATVHGGEYVMRAAAVKAYGAQLFEGLNRMVLPKISSPSISVSVPRVPRYADGGLVAEPGAAGGGAQVDLSIINANSQEEVFKALASKRGRDVILNQIGSDGGHQVRRIVGG